jgi:hypothetical protein
MWECGALVVTAEKLQITSDVILSASLFKDICRTTNGVNQSMSRQQQSQSNYEPAAAKTRGARVSAAGILNRRWAKATMRNALCQLLI